MGLYDKVWASLFLDKGGAVRNVMHPDFGAKGDQTQNDAPAFQAAIDDLPSDGGIVFAPPGKFKLDSGVTLNTGTKRGVAFVGSGGGTILFPAAGITCLTMTGDVGGGEQTKIEDLTIRFATAHANNVGVQVSTPGTTGQAHWVLSRLAIQGDTTPGQFNYLGTGIRLGNASPSGFALEGAIRDCHVQYFNKGLETFSTSNANLISGCKFRVNNYGCYMDALHDGFMVGCTLEANSTDFWLNCTNIYYASGNHFEGAGPGTLTGIDFQNGMLVTIGNSFFPHSSNRNVVVGSTARWVSFGDQLLSGYTSTSAYPIQRLGVPGAMTGPAGSISNWYGGTMAAGQMLQVLNGAGTAIKDLIGYNTLNYVQLGDAWEEATTANTGASGAPPAQVLGYYRIKKANGTNIKIPFYAD